MTATSTDDGPEVDDATTTLELDNATTTLVAVEHAPAAPTAPPAPTTGRSEAAAPPAQRVEAGAGLIAEAELAIAERRWGDAIRVLGAIDSIGASSVHTDGLLAIAASHRNKNRLASEAVSRIRAHPPTIGSQRHLARVAIARHQYQSADQELRSALAMIEADPAAEESAADWANLAASYAGLGWFDEAGECLDRAEQLGATEAETWVVGRSTNRWGMSKTWAAPVGVFLFLLVGLLAFAVAITVPFGVREFRLTQIEERFAAIAADAWSNERWLRLAHATGVLVTVVLWSIATQLT